jgi:hypothetical protein
MMQRIKKQTAYSEHHHHVTFALSACLVTLQALRFFIALTADTVRTSMSKVTTINEICNAR